MRNILILGGDGYLGWPTAMRFSELGCSVTVVDNYFRRRACLELDIPMLYETPSLVSRARRWHELTGREIKVVVVDLAEPEAMRGLFEGRMSYNFSTDGKFPGPPDSVVHYAEQPSAPYSHINFRTAQTTLLNNLAVTNALMFAVRDHSPDTHIIKLGTMGEYGTPNVDIEEGWIEIEHKGRKDRFLFPRQASSLYHTTKIMDTDLLWFGVRTWNLRVTDLMQGPVYGLETDETEMDPRLKTFFNYDEIFGTVLNRFVVQAVCGHPLTIYGKGGQTRGYINIRDTLQCVQMAAQKPAKQGELRIFNQIMEIFSVNDLAEKVAEVGRARGHQVRVERMSNPRKEKEEHYYNPTYQGLREIGVTPHLLDDDVLHGMFEAVERNQKKIRRDVIFRGVTW